MKISNSKKQLARIISENGGWREGAEFAVQGQETKLVGFSKSMPYRRGCGWFIKGEMPVADFKAGHVITNWHQTILSREEYFHLYPAPNAKTEFCESVMRSIPEPSDNPTIEQLAADYRNAKDYADSKLKEADEAKADADAKLKALELAGEALGLLVSPITAKQESELVITDWRDLQVGDIIQCVGSWEKEKTDGMQLPVTALEGPHYNGDRPIRVEVPGISCPGTWGINFKFIRRP